MPEKLVGEGLRLMRLRAGLRCADVAAAAGINEDDLRHLEAGDPCSLNGEASRQLIDAFVRLDIPCPSEEGWGGRVGKDLARILQRIAAPRD